MKQKISSLYLLPAFALLFIGIWSSYFIRSNIVVSAFRERTKISKMKIRLQCESGFKEITISDKAILDSVNLELMKATEIHAQEGGIYDLWADITIYKRNEIEIFVLDSPYNGWMISVGNKLYKSDFIFRWIKRYCP